MIRFNPDNKEVLTYGEALGPAMEITKQKEADQYLADYTAYIQTHLDKKPRTDGHTAEWVAKQNIGYWTGYCDTKIAQRAQRLFHCVHPVFGSF